MKYPIGIQSFADIRKRGFVYVDKTAFIYRMALMGKYYFLSRPRRFGKSLLVSTMEAYFLGQKDLFKGLAIEKLETEWKTYPVLHLDLNARNYEDEESLKAELNKHLVMWEQGYGMTTDSNLAPEERFYNVIHTAYKQSGEQVVVLVDEYDKPLLSTIDNKPLHDAYRKALKAFFSVLKSLDACIRFGFITGVSKFSHVSIFSDLNNLDDISMDPRYVDICGISEEELHIYFDDSIRELADANGMTFEEACERLRKQYDGYHFRQNSVGIYNPFSLLNTFAKKEFNDYWFKTGTPTFLVKLLQQNDYELHDLKGIYVDGDVLSSVDEGYDDPVPVLFQSGYLTIAGYDPELGYRLDFPNQEVERGFFRFLIPYYTSQQQSSVRGILNKMTSAVKRGNPDDLLQTIQTMLAGRSYMVAGADKEKDFQNTLYLIFTMLGYNVQVEQATSQGRIDITIQTKDYIYIIELKLDKTAEEALRQIKDNHYALPFQTDKRKLYLIGVNFSSETRTVEKWVTEEHSRWVFAF
ncbi:ATP-binding protein [Bacteroides gallinaceum]|uniref:ATP-binding protein n=1 Tax=Bacteroides gallinaceum TaxID=1462571 RepID=UPI0025AA53D0|nr:ATP-binding protein [Bacteroides gallinaceum]MDN0080413.1 ATP-binding protein [Bacteroides gallinaceum]